MNKKTIITCLRGFVIPVLTLVAMAGQAQVKCHVVGTVADGTTPVELVIYRDGEDPKNSTLRPLLKNCRFECYMEDAQIERWHIVDFGEVMEKGMTSRSGEFFVEDGASVTIRLDGDDFDIQSTGKEYQAWNDMQKAAEAKFISAYEQLDENDKKKMAELESEYHQWTLDYYKAHPMLGFLFELDGRLKGFHFNDTGLAAMLDIRASEYYKDKLTLVICWASWCAPCIRDACDIIPIYNEYRNRGLNVFSLAHEFKSVDAMRKAVERHTFPWPCLVDLDDEFGVFHKHGTQNSALFLIDRDGTIIAVPNSVEELKAKLDEIFNDNK